MLFLIIEHPLNNLEDCRMIIADLDFVSDIAGFGDRIIGGAKTSTYAETSVGPGYSGAKGGATAVGERTSTNVDNRASAKETDYSYVGKASSSATAYAQDRHSSSRDSSRSIGVYVASGRP